jgi:peptidoglycan/xylan/chitin deacetylase (PgdA/CDA1 family)
MILSASAFTNRLGADFMTRRALRFLKMEFNPSGGQARYPGGRPAASCVSVDFDATRPGRHASNHTGTYALDGLAERYSIPMTWAICGKTAEEDRDAYDRVLNSSVRHEIGIHTYSHVDVSTCTERDLEQEINMCLDSLGISSVPRTFIFPWNREGHFDLLSRLGFIAYRGRDRAIGGPVKMKSLWNIPPVYYLDEKSEGAASLVKRYVDLCIHSKAVFHLWLHPWSIASGDSALPLVSSTLDPILRYIAEKRDDGLLSCCTMGDLASVLDGGKVGTEHEEEVQLSV